MKTRKWIPVISDKELKALSARIKPVVDFPEKKGKYYIKAVDLRNSSFIWDPKPTKKAEDLKSIKDIKTYHTYGYYGLFKPSIAEVIAQIPTKLRDQVVAFEIVVQPETIDDINKEPEALNAGYHVATTRLYSR